MEQLRVFDFYGSRIRTLEIEGTPYFVGKDIAEILGYKNVRDALSKHVDTEDKNTVAIRDGIKRGNPNQTIINESGMYSLIIGSKLPSAKRFKRWVTSEVLPAIRQTGAYLTETAWEKLLDDPDHFVSIVQRWRDEKVRRLAAEQRVQELQPKASYYDKVLQNKALITTTIIAKDYGKSATAFNKLLHKLGVQYKQGETWFLYSKYQSLGWTHSHTTMVTRKDGTEKAVVNTKWTQKGRLGLYELLKANGILPLIERGDD